MLHKAIVFLLAGILGLFPLTLKSSNNDDPDRGPMIDPSGNDGGPEIVPDGLTVGRGPMIDPDGR